MRKTAILAGNNTIARVQLAHSQDLGKQSGNGPRTRVVYFDPYLSTLPRSLPSTTILCQWTDCGLT